MDTLLEFTKAQLRSDLPRINPGDTVKVFQKIKEGNKERVQTFEGIVIAKKHGNGVSATFTVRRVASGVGVERIFPIHSPTIQKIEVLKRARVRRAKLYYLRKKAAKEQRRKMRSEAVPIAQEES